MSRNAVILFALIFAATATLCKKTETPKEEGEVQAVKTEEKKGEEKITGPVAKVNGVDIDNKLFYDEIDKITQGGSRAIPDERLKKIKENILKRLIEEELIRQAIKKENIEVTEKEVEEGYEEYKKRFKTPEQFDNYLKYGKTTVEDIKKRVKEKKALEKLLAKTGSLIPTDEEAKQHYDTN
ncbi:MAG: SurA N-terminal domain-containing protein, partial [Deltaproteobacteria bacterium]|nr:SurA N-terminal domain-containing protein [Deltaproteobacteria bacterium]